MEDKWLEQLRKIKYLPADDLKLLCEKAKEILIEESNVQYVSTPVIICGNICGQIYDLFELFKNGGEIPNSRYIFLGGYVNRGYNSVEVMELLLVLKIKYPDYITLLRGNHELREISFSYGLHNEIMGKYGNSEVFEYFKDLFEYLPISAFIEGKIFYVHGGLSPGFPLIERIRLIPKNKFERLLGGNKNFEGGLLRNVPDDVKGWYIPKRGVDMCFRANIVNTFNRLNGLELICRSHQCIMEGFKYYFENKNLCTIWSAPNYCYRCGNKASILKLDKNLSITILYFNSSENNSKNKPFETLIPNVLYNKKFNTQ